MPVVAFDALPDDARVWVFSAASPVVGDAEVTLLTSVDRWLADWRAHGTPLTAARDWREGRFLVIGVDQTAAGASGCSIDALYRVLLELEGTLGTSLVGGGRVFYRDPSGVVQSVNRAEFGELAGAGGVSDETPVFDTTITRASEYAERFEQPLAQGWQKQLI